MLKKMIDELKSDAYSSRPLTETSGNAVKKSR
jgi:hypothetical protein